MLDLILNATNYAATHCTNKETPNPLPSPNPLSISGLDHLQFIRVAVGVEVELGAEDLAEVEGSRGIEGVELISIIGIEV